MNVIVILIVVFSSNRNWLPLSCNFPNPDGTGSLHVCILTKAKDKGWGILIYIEFAKYTAHPNSEEITDHIVKLSTSLVLSWSKWLV